MNIVFLHGKESDAKNSGKAAAIRKRFPDAGVLVPDYRPRERSFEEIDRFLEDYFAALPLHEKEELFLVGSSLGGYWALRWASRLDASGCILLNPSLNYYGVPPCVAPSLPVTLLVCEDDEVVDPAFALGYLEGSGHIVRFKSGGHRMENVEEMMEEIGRAIRSCCELVCR